MQHKGITVNVSLTMVAITVIAHITSGCYIYIWPGVCLCLFIYVDRDNNCTHIALCIASHSTQFVTVVWILHTGSSSPTDVLPG